MQGRGGRETAKAGAAATGPSGETAARGPGDGGTMRARVVTLRFDPVLQARVASGVWQARWREGRRR